MSGQFKSGQVKFDRFIHSVKGYKGQVYLGQDKLEQFKSGLVKSGHLNLGQVKLSWGG